MNKTLLLIICDFLLLNLLALTRWEEIDQPPAQTTQTSPAESTQQVVQEDLVAALQVTLDEERSTREALNAELQTTQSTLQEREETLAEREQRLADTARTLDEKAREAAQLSERVADTQATVVQLSDRLARTAEQAASSRTQAEQLARELAERQAAAEKLNQQVRQLEQDRVQAQQQIQTLNTQVQVAESARAMLTDNVATLQTQVQAEREERVKLQAQTGTLAEGVTQLAERTGEVRDTIRANTPINANTLFNDFLANRVRAVFHNTRDIPILGPSSRDHEAQTILVSDGTNVYAVFHTEQTPAGDGTADWKEITGTLSAGSRRQSITQLQFLVSDPRLAVVPVDTATATAFGTRIYSTAREPFKFAEAVLVKRGGEDYGEVEFRLDPTTPGYVKMNSSILGRLAGRFSPSAGDMVFSKTGELLGLMVTNNYCVVLDNFQPASALPFGTNLVDQRTSEVLGAQRDRVLRLPLKLQ